MNSDITLLNFADDHFYENTGTDNKCYENSQTEMRFYENIQTDNKDIVGGSEGLQMREAPQASVDDHIDDRRPATADDV